MAKVKIQGNASGTGVLTVTAPNTSTDRTITLPDSTDTLAVNSDVTNKLPLAGGNVTGDLQVSGKLSSAGVAHADSQVMIYTGDATDNGLRINMGSGSYTGTALEVQIAKQSGEDSYTLCKMISKHDNASPATRFSVRGDGLTTVNGILNVKTGITFASDTAAANTLDDYEEGTFTITISGSSSGSGTVTGNAYYTKIGRLCTVSVNFNNQTVPTISGTVQIGLPFAAGNQGEYHGGDIYFYPLSAWTMGSNFVGHTPNIGGVGSTHIFMNKNVNTNRQGAFSTADNGSFSGSGGIYCRYSFTYVTAT